MTPRFLLTLHKPVSHLTPNMSFKLSLMAFSSMFSANSRIGCKFPWRNF
jgi:hypothetical protein